MPPSIQNEIATAKRIIQSTIKNLHKSDSFGKSEVDSLHQTLNKIIVILQAIVDTKSDKK